jgi:hypothetical protein
VSTYDVADLTRSTQDPELQVIGRVRTEEIAKQLKEIRDAISQVINEEPQPGRMGLNSIEIALTVGTEGRVSFVARGSVEASIRLIFTRPEP